MGTRSFFRALSSFFRLATPPEAARIYSPEEFRAILDRERTRCERNSHEFSLVLVDLGQVWTDHAAVAEIAKVIAGRSRCTDEPGWLDRERIGVVLPDTSNDGARRFAWDLKARIAAKVAAALKYSVYTYPSERLPHSNGTSRLRQLTFADVSPSFAEAEEQSPPPREGAEGGASSRRQSDRRVEEEKPEEAAVGRTHLIGYHRIPAWKRTMDCVGAAGLVVCWFPVFVALAVWVKAVSRGPIFFKQERVGIDGKPFTCWKFRTMHVNSDVSGHRDYVTSLIKQAGAAGDDKPMTKLDATSSQIIPFGKAIRKTGLDELPQLLNVLRGEMSLVGPRPCLPYEFEEYSQWHTRRCDAPPGLTGLWQVSGKNRTTFKEMMRLDIVYARRASFWLDVKILLMTVPAIIGQMKR